MNRTGIIALTAGILVLAGIIFGGYQYSVLSTELSETRLELASTTEAARTMQTTLSANLAKKADEATNLVALLRAEQRKNGNFEEQLSSLSGTVGTLEKLAKTDPELLAKYSKVYFLNENYAPPALSSINSEYLFQKDRTLELHQSVAPNMEDLLEDAKEDGIDLLVISAFRSFSTQAALKSNYRVTFGSGANAFSADQGYSEHQLGTTVDFTTAAVGASFSGFDKAPAYAWLTDNAWKYGFVLSYPKGNTFYQYEPWHWRFVGKGLAKYLHEENLHFYDLDQRTIDGYLAEIFD